MAAAAPTIDRPRPEERARSVRWPWIALAFVVVAALTLLIADQPTYDPTAWLIWGREIVHNDLSTRAGPSWKPLPVVVTTLTSVLGDPAQAQIWLVVARVGTLTAIAMTYRLAWRLEGAIAGVIAVAALVLATGFLTRTFRGDSEGVLVALALGAIETHLAGRRWATFGLIAATTLMRPELALFAAGYGLWMILTAPPGRARWRILGIAAGAGIVVVAAWLVPEKIGSGDLFRAASRALEPVAGSPATASRPFVATFTNAAPVLAWPLYAAGLAYVVLTIRDRGRGRGGWLPVVIAALSTALMALVAAMAEGGFTGNIRYLTLPVALACVLGGAGFVHLARLARARLSPAVATALIVLAALVSAPFVLHTLNRTRHEFRGGMAESRNYAALPGVVARVGGIDAVRRCGTVESAWYDTQTVARLLHVHQYQVGLTQRVPGTVLYRVGSGIPINRRFSHEVRTNRWAVASTCAPPRG